MSHKRQPTDVRTAAKKWQTHPFESREDWRPRKKDAPTQTVMVLDKHRLRVREADFERLLDLLMKTSRSTIARLSKATSRSRRVSTTTIPIKYQTATASGS
jgi:hypothetical protein